MRLARVMAFYDGHFFKQGQVFFNYKEHRGWFSLPSLHALFESYVAEKSKTPADITKLVAAHYYDGRLPTSVAYASQLEKDRDFEHALMDAGIVPHYLAVSEKTVASPDTEDLRWKIGQKGVDVQLALDVLDYAHEDRYDVAVLVTGDGDFVPLVRRITSLNKHVLWAYFNIDEWKDERGKLHRPTYASRDLIDAASWSLNFNQLVRDPDWKTYVKPLFFKPKSPDEKLDRIRTQATRATRAASRSSSARLFGPRPSAT